MGRHFMQYIHTLVPLSIVADAAIVSHVPCALGLELTALLRFVALYLGWNFFCWWLLKAAPYPLQKRIYHLGLSRAVASYVSLVVGGLGVFGYMRLLRTESGHVWRAVEALPLA